jgi:CBS domain-containing protein
MYPTVADVMSTDLVVVTRSTPYKQLVTKMREHGIRALPVVDPGDRLAGIVTETDLALKQEYRPSDRVPFLEGMTQRRDRRKAAATVAEQCMSRPAAVVGPSATVPEAARLLHRRGVHHLPVVDEHGRLVGIVSRRDLLAVLLRGDDEIARSVRHGVLRATLDLPEDAIDVQVVEGVVRLRGTVELRSQAREIGKLTQVIQGVVGVVDELDYRRDDTVPSWPRPHA